MHESRLFIDRNQYCLDQLVSGKIGKIKVCTTDCVVNYEEFENLEALEKPDELDIFEDVPEP